MTPTLALALAQCKRYDGAMTKVLYVRIEQGTHEWLAGMAAEAGVSLARATETVLSEARVRGWSVARPHLTEAAREQAEQAESARPQRAS